MSAYVYRIVNDINEEFYVGSTKQALCKRFYGHKSNSKIEKLANRNLYKLANEIGWGCFRIVLIEEFEFVSKQELLKREQHWIDELKPSLNKMSAYVNCPHGRWHNKCIDCGGAGICEHNRVRSQCKDCKGGGICEHNKQRSQCKECKGGGICEHSKQRGSCKGCNNFTCEFCDKKYSTKTYLKKHLTKKHNG